MNLPPKFISVCVIAHLTHLTHLLARSKLNLREQNALTTFQKEAFFY